MTKACGLCGIWVPAFAAASGEHRSSRPLDAAGARADRSPDAAGRQARSLHRNGEEARKADRTRTGRSRPVLRVAERCTSRRSAKDGSSAGINERRMHRKSPPICDSHNPPLRNRCRLHLHGSSLEQKCGEDWAGVKHGVPCYAAAVRTTLRSPGRSARRGSRVPAVGVKVPIQLHPAHKSRGARRPLVRTGQVEQADRLRDQSASPIGNIQALTKIRR